ncbi:MAG: heme ABC exporter ATP-binding protein CcmA [Alphaproteobacteria bacterium]
MLRAQTLACRRGDRLVFAGLDFELGAGAAAVVRGPNGAGKSSLLRILATLLRPESGRVTWDDADIFAAEGYRARLHYVGHLAAIKPAFTVAENLAFWQRLRGQPADPAALDTFGIGPLADIPAQWLSAGQRQRLSLSRLAAIPAPLWLLDEPTTSLDDAGIAALVAAIAAHRASGGRLLLTTHLPLDLPDAETIWIGAGR